MLGISYFYKKMELKKHHKIIIGSFSSIVLVFMIVSGILIFTLFAKQEINYNDLNSGITDIHSKITELTEVLIETQSNVNSLGTHVTSINEEFDLLKASAGDDFSGIIENSVKSVVTIMTDISQGTGFIISEEGYVITNAHVLSGAKEVTAINYNQEMLNTEFIGYDQNFDIALLKITGNYNKLNFANSDDVSIGEQVIAIGNPLGLQFSVTKGIVSAVHREGINGEEAYIQTDAALNPGNSGGPLINKQGEVIGINNFKVSSGESLGFALESNYIKEVVNDIAYEFLNQTLI